MYIVSYPADTQHCCPTAYSSAQQTPTPKPKSSSETATARTGSLKEHHRRTQQQPSPSVTSRPLLQNAGRVMTGDHEYITTDNPNLLGVHTYDATHHICSTSARVLCTVCTYVCSSSATAASKQASK